MSFALKKPLLPADLLDEENTRAEENTRPISRQVLATWLIDGTSRKTHKSITMFQNLHCLDIFKELPTIDVLLQNFPENSA